jgi:hypothetical protein
VDLIMAVKSFVIQALVFFIDDAAAKKARVFVTG